MSLRPGPIPVATPDPCLHFLFFLLLLSSLVWTHYSHSISNSYACWKPWRCKAALKSTGQPAIFTLFFVLLEHICVMQITIFLMSHQLYKFLVYLFPKYWFFPSYLLFRGSIKYIFRSFSHNLYIFYTVFCILSSFALLYYSVVNIFFWHIPVCLLFLQLFLTCY